MTDNGTYTRRQLVGRGAALAGAAGLASIAGPDALAGVLAAPAPVRGGTLRVGILGTPAESRHPYQGGAYSGFFRTRLIFEPMLARDYNTDEILYVLAESCKPNSDGSQWTVVLRDGIKFHDGSSLDAADILYTFDAVSKSNLGSSLVGLGIAPNGIKAVNRKTVRFTLTTPVADWDERLSLRNDLVVIRNGDTNFLNESIGTGPFKLTEFNAGTSASLVANRKYWRKEGRGLPYLNGVSILVLPSADARVNALRGGLADYAVDLPYTAAKLNQNSKIIQLRRSAAASGGINFFSLNARHKPFDDPRVRLAFKLACDRKEMITQSLLGFGIPGNDLVSQGWQDVDRNLGPRGYDPARARTLLQQAGASGVKVVITELTGFTAPGSSALYAEQLKRVGVDASVQGLTLAQYARDVPGAVAGSQMFALQGGNAPFTQNASIFMLSNSALNLWGWFRPAWDAKFAKAQAIFNKSQRIAAYHALQKEFFNDGGMVTWAINPVVNGAIPRLQGMRDKSFGYARTPNVSAAWFLKK